MEILRKVRCDISGKYFQNGLLDNNYILSCVLIFMCGIQKLHSTDIINSPVLGTLDVTVIGGVLCDETSSQTNWCFNQRMCTSPLTHCPGKGIDGADDTYSWDGNLGDNATDDTGLPVYAVANGIIERVTPEWGEILIKHEYVSGKIRYSSYMHMKNLQYDKSDEGNTFVESGVYLGNISNTRKPFTPYFSEHLHFTWYKEDNSTYKSLDAVILENAITPHFGEVISARNSANNTRIYFQIPQQFRNTLGSFNIAQITDLAITDPNSFDLIHNTSLITNVISDGSLGYYFEIPLEVNQETPIVEGRYYDIQFKIPKTPDIKYDIVAYGHQQVYFTSCDINEDIEPNGNHNSKVDLGYLGSADYGTIKRGNLFYPKDRDIYSFYTLQEGTAGIGLVNTGERLAVNIYNSKLEIISSFEQFPGEENSHEIGCVDKGRYYVQIWNPNENVQCEPYFLAFAWNPNKYVCEDFAGIKENFVKSLSCTDCQEIDIRTPSISPLYDGSNYKIESHLIGIDLIQYYNVFAVDESGLVGTTLGNVKAVSATDLAPNILINDIPCGSNVILRVEHVDNPDDCFREMLLSIPDCESQDKSITLNWPLLQGACIEAGNTVAVSWSSANIEKIDISLCALGGSCVKLVENYQNTESYAWTMPQGTGTFYLKIEDADVGHICDESHVFDILNDCYGSDCTPIEVTLTEPANGSSYFPSQSFTLKFSDQIIGNDPCPFTEYELCISDESDFSGGSNDCYVLAGQSFQINSGMLEGIYYWRVRTKYGNEGYGPWSGSKSFMIQSDFPNYTLGEMLVCPNWLFSGTNCALEQTEFEIGDTVNASLEIDNVGKDYRLTTTWRFKGDELFIHYSEWSDNSDDLEYGVSFTPTRSGDYTIQFILETLDADDGDIDYHPIGFKSFKVNGLDFCDLDCPDIDYRFEIPTSTSCELIWTSLSLSTCQTQVRYKRTSDTEWISAAINDCCGTVITDLAPNASYEWQIRTKCIDDDIIDQYLPSRLFFTESSCGDGIRNEDELGIDCGGLLCEPCLCQDIGYLIDYNIYDDEQIQVKQDVLAEKSVYAANVQIKAEGNVRLTPGFHATSGSVLTARIKECQGCGGDDAIALITLYNSTNGDAWNNNSGWIDGVDGNNCDPCGLIEGNEAWHGIQCEGNKVTRINLRSNHLSGSIPLNLNLLKYLKSLDLSDNNLSGEIPSTVGELENLNTLLLSKNSIGGSIPREITNLDQLQTVNLSTNELSGNLPFSIGNLSSLKLLQANNNQLEGSIPESIGLLSKIELLQLSHNTLSGAIPQSISGMNALQVLALDNNQLNGQIPKELSELPNLFGLSLSNNNLSGCIYRELKSLCGKSIQLDNNPSLPDWDAFCQDYSGACPTCDDGILNQDETCVDCGGPNCEVCIQTCNETDYSLIKSTSLSDTSGCINLSMFEDKLYVARTKGGFSIVDDSTFQELQYYVLDNTESSILKFDNHEEGYVFALIEYFQSNGIGLLVKDSHNNSIDTIYKTIDNFNLGSHPTDMYVSCEGHLYYTTENESDSIITLSHFVNDLQFGRPISKSSSVVVHNRFVNDEKNNLVRFRKNTVDLAMTTLCDDTDIRYTEHEIQAAYQEDSYNHALVASIDELGNTYLEYHRLRGFSGNGDDPLFIKNIGHYNVDQVIVSSDYIYLLNRELNELSIRYKESHPNYFEEVDRIRFDFVPHSFICNENCNEIFVSDYRRNKVYFFKNLFQE